MIPGIARGIFVSVSFAQSLELYFFLLTIGFFDL